MGKFYNFVGKWTTYTFLFLASEVAVAHFCAKCRKTLDEQVPIFRSVNLTMLGSAKEKDD